jgi:hypothetical protein
MAIRLVLDIFSGRPNPYIEFADGKLAKTFSHYVVQRLLAEAVTDELPPSTLGYRGIYLEETNPRSARFGRHRISESAGLIAELVGTSGKGQLADYVVQMAPARQGGKVRREFKLFREFVAEKEAASTRKGKTPGCRCAPLYEPVWWNDGAQRQLNNNCYNYSANYRTDTFAQPGRAAGALYSAVSCAAVHAAAIADDLQGTAIENECPDDGHLVALVIAPGVDFHWYRKGRDGLWTHKPGGTAATNLDNSGHIITDPRTANRGPYTDFCRFMVVQHGHIKLQ